MSTVTNASNTRFADKVQMQHRLFSELSAMFGQEVPLYDKSLLVNRLCNRAVCDLLGLVHTGFAVDDNQLEKTSGERHGAIRIGRADEYRWIGRLFAQFAMEPHNFYDMTSVGAKSQPVIATAFRSVVNPEHRVFTSLLTTNYFAPSTAARIDDLLNQRQVFSDNAKRLIEKGEREGGLSWADADDLIREGITRIFKWTGRARGYGLYKELCDGGFKIAADIACFERHHLNHLTPNTFCIDLFSSAMKLCMGEITGAEFGTRAERFLSRMAQRADKHTLCLLFRHLTHEQIDGFGSGTASEAQVSSIANTLTERLKQPDCQLSKLNHAGFKDFTEGPSEDTPVLLRQDAYKAMPEAVTFIEDDGTEIKAEHTARFGEIEQRAYATTPSGRALYDKCLSEVEAARDADRTLPRRDFAAFEALSAQAFTPFAKTLDGLLNAGAVYGKYSATPKGEAARGTIHTTDVHELVRRGFARVEGLRHEDFLPVSAAGIFASNLNQYGTKSTAAVKPTYTRAMLEEILGKKIIDADAVYAGIQARSVIDTYEALGITSLVPAAEMESLRRSAEVADQAGAMASETSRIHTPAFAGA